MRSSIGRNGEGPNRDGAVPPEPAKPWPERLRQVWNVKVGEGHSSPVVSGKRVYQFAELQDNEVVAAYDLDSGKPIWKQTYAAPYQMNPAATAHGKGPKSTPVVAGNRLYTVGISGILTCWDCGDAAKRSGISTARVRRCIGQASSPVVDRGTLIASVGPQSGGALTAFDAATGKVKWQWKEDGPAYASPVIAEPGGVRQVITNSQSHIVGVSISRRKAALETAAEDARTTRTALLRSSSATWSSTPACRNPVTAIRPGNPPQQVWENKEVGMYMNSPVLAAGVLWGLSHRNKGQFFGLNPKTGKTVWTGEGRQADNAAMIARGSTVFALTTNSELLVFEASASNLKQVAKYSVADTPTWAHPVILGNRVLVKDRSSLALWSAE